MSKNIQYDEVVIKSTELSEILSKFGAVEASSLAKTISIYSLEILKENMTDNNDLLYFRFALPLYNICKDLDIRGVKSKSYHILDILTPEYIRAKRRNESILYSQYLRQR